MHKMYCEKLEAKTIESESRLHNLRTAEAQVSALTQEKHRLTDDFNSLQNKYDVLLEDYRKATTADGLTYDGPSTISTWQGISMSTGDRIRFKLASGSLYLHIVRVTEDGPIMRASGCQPRLVDTSFVSERDGPSAYCLHTGKKLHLQVSCKASSQGYLSADLSDLEDVLIICTSFDVKQQEASVKFKKSLIGR